MKKDHKDIPSWRGKLSRVLVLLLIVFAISQQKMFPQGTQVDWVTQVKNTPVFDTRTYDFTPQSVTSTVPSGSTATITLKPCPLGVSGVDENHYLYISGGTGTAEAVLISGGTCTSGLKAGGTVLITPTNPHSGTWKITSATAGGKEAEEVAEGAGGGIVQFPTGVAALNAPLVVPSQVIISGAGRDTTYLVGALSVTPVVQVGSSTIHTFNSQIRDLTVTRAAGSIPSGSIGIDWVWFNGGAQWGVRVTRSDVLELFDYKDNSSLSATVDIYNSYFDTASTAYIEVNRAAEIHFYGGSLGALGSESPNPTEAILITGPANDIRFVGLNIIPKTVGTKTAYAVALVNTGSNSTGTLAFDTCHFENFATAYFYSDSNSQSLSNLQISNTTFSDPTVELFALNAATQLKATTIVGSTIPGPITLADPLWVSFTGNFLAGVINMSGGGSANVNLAGNVIGTSATFTGAWVQLAVNSNSFYGGTHLDVSGATGSITYGNTFDSSITSHFFPSGAILNQGADTITSDPPSVLSTNGWKEVYYTAAGAKIAFGLAPNTGYFRGDHFYCWGNTNPNGDGTTSSADTAGKACVDLNLGEIRPSVKTFSTLPGVAPSGYSIYCSDCTTAATCTSGGSGHMAVSNGTNWTCQ